MNNNRGVTLIELMVVVIIIGILAAVSVPVYRGYVRDGIAQEGFAVLEALNAAQNAYHATYGEFRDLSVDTTDYCPVLDVDARNNEYFRAYKYSGDAESWQGTAICNRDGWELSACMTGYRDAPPVTKIEGM